METINKVRGKCLDNAKWIFGFYYQEFDNTYIIESGQNDNGQLYRNIYCVIPMTVGQFTGRCDKCGKKIYVGDIMGKHTDNGNLVPLSLIVSEDNGFYAKSLVTGATFNFNVLMVIEKQTVIGNIHDNPELLSK